MGTSQATIKEWLERGKEEGATHVIVVCDTFDHDDYPVMVKPGENPRKKADEYNEKSMQRIMEVYNLSMSIPEQLAQRRVFNF